MSKEIPLRDDFRLVSLSPEMKGHFHSAVSTELDHIRILENSIGFNLFINAITHNFIPEYQAEMERETDPVKIFRLQGKIESAKRIAFDLLPMMIEKRQEAGK